MADDIIIKKTTVHKYVEKNYDIHAYIDLTKGGDAEFFDSNEIYEMLFDLDLSDEEIASVIEFISEAENGKYVYDDDIKISDHELANILEAIDGNEKNDNGILTRREIKKAAQDIHSGESKEIFKDYAEDGSFSHGTLNNLLMNEFSDLSEEERGEILDLFFVGGKDSVSLYEVFATLDIDNSETISIGEMRSTEASINTATEGEEISFQSRQKDGVCWFHTGINTIANTQDGQDLIDQSVDKLPDGGYKITFPSQPDKTYFISPKDMAKEKITMDDDTFTLSDGQDPVLKALEIAAFRHSKFYPDSLGDDEFVGGSTRKVANLFNIEHKTTQFKEGDDLTDFIMNYPEDAPINLTMGYESTGVGVQEGENYLDKIETRTETESSTPAYHGVTITDINKKDGTVTIRDPNSPQVEHIVPIEELEEHNVVEIVDFKI